MQRYDLIIIGAGAAGLYAAANMPAYLSVLVLEQGSKAGRKLLLTGGGRCNLTHVGEANELIEHYYPQNKFLLGPLNRHTPRDVRRFFDEQGLKTIADQTGKVYPKSNDAKDVVNTLVHAITKEGHEIACNNPVRSIEKINLLDARWSVTTENGRKFHAHAILIATGGASYPGTGSDAKLWPCLKALGLELSPAKPALVDLLWVDLQTQVEYSNFSGISLKGISLSLDNTTVRGDLLFTHRGLSGPSALNLSGHFMGEMGDVILNFYPDLDQHELLVKMQAFTQLKPTAMFSSLLARVLPKALAKYIGERYYAELIDRHLSQVGHSELERLALQLQNFPLPRLKPGRVISGMVTRGGVKTWQLSPRTMEAKALEGLYLAGEVLDIDGQTGGYNLQAAFSTAYVAVEALRGW